MILIERCRQREDHADEKIDQRSADGSGGQFAIYAIGKRKPDLGLELAPGPGFLGGAVSVFRLNNLAHLPQPDILWKDTRVGSVSPAQWELGNNNTNYCLKSRGISEKKSEIQTPAAITAGPGPRCGSGPDCLPGRCTPSTRPFGPDDCGQSDEKAFRRRRDRQSGSHPPDCPDPDEC